MENDLREKFSLPQWEKYKALCKVNMKQIPVDRGERELALFHIMPNDANLQSNKAYIYAHQGGGLMFDGELFIDMAFRTAVMFKTHVFLVDYWKERDTRAPRGAKDFAEAVEYINNNSTKFGIHKDHICVGGAGPGAWVVLGAMQ
jgi:acetyl esterase/lipase